MVSFRKGKKRYKVNELGSLYIDETKLSSNDQSIIYIGGQMEHRGHVIEGTGYTMDTNHNAFAGSWMYEYPITRNNKADYNAENFSENLLAALREARLSEVVLLTHSHGGLIGAYASKSELIDKVISVHPPILGTPLANLEHIEKYRSLLTKTQKLLVKLVSVIVNSDYGFQMDNLNGVDLSKVDLNKLLVVGNHLDVDSEKNKIMLETYHIIETICGRKNDGVVLFDGDAFSEKGINYFVMPEHINHLQSSNPEYFEDILKRVLKK